MRLFTKIALGIAGFFLSISLISGVIAVSMGMNVDKFQDMVRNGAFSISFGKDNEVSFFGDDIEWEYEENHVLKGDIIKTIEQDCMDLELEIEAGQLEICYGDVENIQIEGKNIQGLKVATGGKEGEGTLYMESGIDVIDRTDSLLKIILPKGKRFREVELELGASQADIDGLLAEYIELSIDTGQAHISNVDTRTLDMEVGAGQADITNLTIWNLNLEVGVGEANVQLNGAEKDFSYRIECGIGEVVVGNHSYGGFGAEQNIKNSDTSYLIDIECGIGSVDMQFLCDDVTDDSCQENSHHHGN